MALVHKIERKPDQHGPDLMIFCPACQCGHGIWITEKSPSGGQWQFNGNFEKPTFTPSLLVAPFAKADDPIKRCHSNITDGMISYGSDCGHALAGKTVPLEDF